MACDTGKIEAKENVKIQIENQNIKENINMNNSSLVLRKVPDFKVDAYDAYTGHFITVDNSKYLGKWFVVCFYPADFTFVCPTEIAAMNAKYDEFKELGVEILAVSTDSKFSHKIFAET